MTPDPAKLIELAGRTDLRGGRHEQAMRDEFDMGDVEFWRQVNAVLDDPPADVALSHGPTINRLRRLRASRQRQRTAVHPAS